MKCKRCAFIKWYFLVIVIAAVTVKFYPEYSAFINSLLLVGIPVLSGLSPSELGFKEFRKGFFYGFIVSLVILLPFYLLLKILHLKFCSYHLSLNALLYFFTVAVSEEVFFRGYLYSQIENEPFLPLISKANFISSFLFATAHVLVFYDPSMFKVFFPSLVMGWLYERSGSIVAPIVFHFLSDLVYCLG